MMLWGKDRPSIYPFPFSLEDVLLDNRWGHQLFPPAVKKPHTTTKEEQRGAVAQKKTKDNQNSSRKNNFSDVRLLVELLDPFLQLLVDLLQSHFLSHGDKLLSTYRG